MEIIKKLNLKQKIYENDPVTIAFLGDSVTQGCFECYIKSDGKIETVFDYKSAYSTRLREILNILYPRFLCNIYKFHPAEVYNSKKELPTQPHILHSLHALPSSQYLLQKPPQYVRLPALDHLLFSS